MIDSDHASSQYQDDRSSVASRESDGLAPGVGVGGGAARRGSGAGIAEGTVAGEGGGDSTAGTGTGTGHASEPHSDSESGSEGKVTAGEFTRPLLSMIWALQCLCIHVHLHDFVRLLVCVGLCDCLFHCSCCCCMSSQSTVYPFCITVSIFHTPVAHVVLSGTAVVDIPKVGEKLMPVPEGSLLTPGDSQKRSEMVRIRLGH